MANVVLMLVGVGLLVVQGLVALGPWDRFVPSLILPMVLYMAVGEFSLARGVSLAFVLGYLTDAFAGGSLGLWTFTLVSVFLLARIAGLKLFLHGVVFQVVLTFLASCVAGLEMAGLLLVFDQRPLSVASAFGVVVTQSLATAALAPWVFWLIRQIPGTYTSRPEEL